MLVYCLVYFSTLKMEAIYLFKMSVDFHRITSHYIPEDRTLHNHGCENFTSYLNVIASTDLKIPFQEASTSFTLQTSHSRFCFNYFRVYFPLSLYTSRLVLSSKGSNFVHSLSIKGKPFVLLNTLKPSGYHHLI
jgi:hypothetical protein